MPLVTGRSGSGVVEHMNPYHGPRPTRIGGQRRSKRAIAAGQNKVQRGFTNMGVLERLGTGALGALFAGTGVVKRGPVGWCLVAIGGAMVARGASGYCPLYRRMGVNHAKRLAPTPRDYYEHGVRIEAEIMVNRKSADCFAFWRKLDNLPRFMDRLESVEVIDNDRSRWIAKPALGIPMQWEATIIAEETGRRLAWQSDDGSQLHNTGAVRFDENKDVTRVTVEMECLPPGGHFSEALARIFGNDPQAQLNSDLARFKQLMEADTQSESRGRSSTK